MKLWKLTDRRMLLILIGVLVAIVIGFNSKASDLKMYTLHQESNDQRSQSIRSMKQLRTTYRFMEGFINHHLTHNLD